MIEEVEVVVINKPLLYAGVTHPVDAVLMIPASDADLLLTFKMVSERGTRKKRKGKKPVRKKNPARYPDHPSHGDRNRRDMVLEGEAK